MVRMPMRRLSAKARMRRLSSSMSRSTSQRNSGLKESMSSRGVAWIGGMRLNSYPGPVGQVSRALAARPPVVEL